jgi:signal recognition particle subunit SRP54
MGDVISLVEKAQENFSEEEARKLQRKIEKNQFDLNDFLGQLQQIKKMGNVKDLMGMVPGMGKAMKDVDIKEDAFKHIEAIILSMTPQERTNPAILNGQRKNRIAKGSGLNVVEVNKLLKQFEDTRKMMKMMSNPKNMMGMMSKLKGMGMKGLPGM